MTPVPLVSQIAASPLSFCHSRSGLPSPLKSPVALTCQLGPGLPRLPPPVIALPLLAQMNGLAAVVLQQDVAAVALP